MASRSPAAAQETRHGTCPGGGDISFILLLNTAGCQERRRKSPFLRNQPVPSGWGGAKLGLHHSGSPSAQGDNEPCGPRRQRPATEPCQRCHDPRDTSSCSFDTYVLHLTNRHNRIATNYCCLLSYVWHLTDRQSLPNRPIICLPKCLGRCR